MADTYTTLTDADKLLIAKDTLRGKESDRYRISILNEPNKDQRLAEFDTDIESLLAEVTRLEAATAPVDEEPPLDEDEPVTE